MSYTYVPGVGYTVRDWRGRVLGSGLTVAQRDAMLAEQHRVVMNLARTKLAQ